MGEKRGYHEWTRMDTNGIGIPDIPYMNSCSFVSIRGSFYI